MRADIPSATRSNQLGVALVASAGLAAVIITTSVRDGSPLGAPAYWAWILTGLQVVALRAAAAGNGAGWLLGASVQLPWIAYALVTGQLGFIPGCLISGAVQAHGYVRSHQPALRRNLEEPTYA